MTVLMRRLQPRSSKNEVQQWCQGQLLLALSHAFLQWETFEQKEKGVANQ